MKFEILHIQSLPSTNQYLFNLISEEDVVEGLVINTESQTAGKGMGTNLWESESGKNLSFSLLIKPDFMKPENQFVITQIVSLAIQNVCQKNLNREDVKIKWPNDIYVGNKKLAGILVQNIIKANNISHSVIGIGLNVNQMNFVSDAPNPVSMRQLSGIEFNRDKLLNEILFEIQENYSRIKIYPVSVWLKSRYLENLFRINQVHLFTDKNGKFKGEIVGIDDFGQLKIKKSDGEITLYGYKEVEFENKLKPGR